MLVDGFPAVGGRAEGGLVSAACTTVNSDSAVNIRPGPSNQSTVGSAIYLGDALLHRRGRIGRTSSVRCMLLDLSDQLRYRIPIAFAAGLVQLLDILGGLRLFPLWHEVSAGILRRSQSV